MTLAELFSLIDTHINTKSGTDRITGATDNMVRKETIKGLMDIISTGFGGDISPADDPGTFTNPIYFIAEATGVYDYCGGVEVTKLPAFIIFDGNEWSVRQFDISVQVEGDQTSAKGVVFDGDQEPSGPAIGDYYVLLGPGSITWGARTFSSPGIVYCTSTNPAEWEHEKFEKQLGINDITDLADALQDAIDAASNAQDSIYNHKINLEGAHPAGAISSGSGSDVETELGKKLEDAPQDNKSYLRKNGTWTELPEQSAGLASTWEVDAAAIRALTDHEAGMDVGNYATGVVYEYDDTSTSADDGDTILKPDDVDSADPGRWVKQKTFSTEGHTHQATEVSMNDGKTVQEAVNETRKQDVAFSTNIPFNSILTSMPLTASDAERVFAPITADAIAGGRCIVTLTADGNSANVPGFDPAFKQSPDSMIWSNVTGTNNTIDFWYDGTTYWYKIIRDESNIAYKSDVLLKGGASGPFTPTHDDDPVPKKWTEDQIKQFVANYYPGQPSPDGEDLGWYGVEWDEGRVNSGCIRTGSLSGYRGGGAYGELGYNIDTRPLSNIPENLLFVHNKIKSVMLKDDGTENYDLDQFNNYNKSGVSPSVTGTVTTAGTTSLISTGAFTGVEDDYKGRYVHITTSGKLNIYCLITGKVSDDELSISDPRNGSPTADIFAIDDTFEICTARFDGVDGQAMVKIPKFYYFMTFETSPVDSSKSVVKLGVSLYPYDDFSVHPAFIDGDDNEVDAIYYSKFEAIPDGSTLASLPNSLPQTDQTIGTFRTEAQSRGAGWQQEMFWYRSAIQMLFYVEYADLNSQMRLPAFTEGPSSEDWKRKTGRTLSAGNSSVSITADSFYDSDIYDSEDWNEHETVAMCYRGIENLYGHIWTWLDGMNVNDYNVYVTNNKSVLDSNTSTGYDDLQVDLPGNNYFSEIHPIGGAIIPKSTGGSSVNYYTDYVWNNTGWRVARAGGLLSDGARAGVAALHAYSDSASSTWNFGARLCF